MDKLNFISLFSVLMLMVACNHQGPYAREMQQVDSLQHEVQRYHIMMDSLSTESVREVMAEVDQRLEKLMTASVPRDDKQFWVNEVGQLATARKALNRYVENEAEIDEKIGFTQHQLSTLQNSLNDEKLNESEARQYLATESQASQQIRFQVMKTYQAAREAMRFWEREQPHYDELVEGLPTKG